MNNVKMECYSDMKTGKRCFYVEKDGRVICSDVLSSNCENYKLGVFRVLRDGLISVRNLVKHDDMLTIVIQNPSIVSWIQYSDEKKYDKYSEVTDEVFDLLDELDCKYRFVSAGSQDLKKRVSRVAKKKEVKELGVVDILDMG